AKALWLLTFPRHESPFTVPLCRLHHRELHRSGNETRPPSSERWPPSIGTHGRVQSESPAAIIGIRIVTEPAERAHPRIVAQSRSDDALSGYGFPEPCVRS